MPGKVKVKIIAGKNLPVMDRSNDTTDAYVEVKLGTTTYKTEVCKKSLNPQWNSDWYRFEVDDLELQDEPLQIRLMDHDTYSANDVIGKVYLDLNPLLLSSSTIFPKFGRTGDLSSNNDHATNSVLSGWFPVYDTMHGIRGEVNVIVKVELFSDFNKFRQSSCGVQFFCSPIVPHGYGMQMYHGFVEELIVNGDPEYQWIDKIRTPRASNEARQTLFFKLSGELQRKIGLKTLGLGGNAVVGYSQCFDLEGELGIVVRGCGTAVTLIRIRENPSIPVLDSTNEERALSYLEFLRFNRGFHLNRNNLNNPIHSKPLNTSASLSQKNEDDSTIHQNLKQKKSLTRHLSYNEFIPSSISTKTLNQTMYNNLQHASSLQTILRQEDLRGNPGSGISQRIRNFKYSSQNTLAKKITALKAKLTDSRMQEEANVNSCSNSNSNLDIYANKPFHKNNSSMAELLIQSIIHANLNDSKLDPTKFTENTSTFEQNLIENYYRSNDLLNKSVSEPDIFLDNNSYSSNFDFPSESSSSNDDDDDDDESIIDEPNENKSDTDTISNIIKNVINNQNLPFNTILVDHDNLTQESLIFKNTEIKVSEESDSNIVTFNKIAPLAKPEDFDVEDNTFVNVINDNTMDNLISPNLKPQTEINVTNSIKYIIPSVKVNKDTMKKQSLMQTAMQTMLLDKLNLVGVYTPPSSPTLCNQNTTFESNKKTFSVKSKYKIIQKLPSVFGNKYKIKQNKVDDQPNKKDLETIDYSTLNTHSDKQLHKIKRSFSNSSTNLISTNDVQNLINSVNLTSCLQSVPHNMPVNAELDKGINNNMHASLASSLRTVGSPSTEPIRQGHTHQRTESYGVKILQSPARFNPVTFIHRRSSDSDLSITPKGNSLTGSDKSFGIPASYILRVGGLLRTNIAQDNIDMLEYPFITMMQYPPGFIIYLGGVVSARSVKLLRKITNLEEPESRDAWWTELRMEIRSHARTLQCNTILAYSETSSICDDVCILSASGTAAVTTFQYTGDTDINYLPPISKQYYGNKDFAATSLDRPDLDKEKTTQKNDSSNGTKFLPESPQTEIFINNVNSAPSCSVCHLPYFGNCLPLKIITLKCAICRMGKVPEVLLATIEMPENIPSVGRGCFIEAYVYRQLKDLRSESNAKDISDGLPFLEYELHRILINKIRIKGMNAIFGLKIRISIGSKMLVGVATGTAVFLLPLPSPPVPKLVSLRPGNENQLANMQQLLNDTVETNKDIYQLKITEDLQNFQTSPDKDHLENEHSYLDLSLENRDCCILEVDDPEDMEIMNLLMEARPPDGFHVVNTQQVPGFEESELLKNIQMFTQIWRSKIYPSFNFDKHVQKLLQGVYFKLRKMVPCALCDLKFRVDLPESDEIQLTVLGMALSLSELQKSLKNKQKNAHVSTRNDDDMIFNLEDDSTDCNNQQSGTNLLNVQSAKHKVKSPYRTKVFPSKQSVPLRENYGIDITTLSYIPGGKIERYLGNLNFFFIRETTSIREEGGLSGFIHSFITEVLAIVRAHIMGLGGNAMVAYYMTECILSHSLHKNQGQCLINVGGDVVLVSYYGEE